MKKNNSSLFSTIAFALFIVWGIGTLVTIILNKIGVSTDLARVVEFINKLLTICAMIVMVVSAYGFYQSNKSNKLVFWLFWISVVVAIVCVVLPFVL